MADSNEHDPRDGAASAGEPQPTERPGGGPPPPAGHPGGPGAPGAPQTEFLETGRTAPPYVEGAAAPPPAGPRRPGRWRRWSSNGTVRVGAITLVAGLVGGLIGGGIVAAFSDNGGPDRSARFVQHGVNRGGAPGLRGPRYWMPPNGNGRGAPNRRFPVPVPPGMSGRPVPAPSPSSSG